MKERRRNVGYAIELKERNWACSKKIKVNGGGKTKQLAGWFWKVQVRDRGIAIGFGNWSESRGETTKVDKCWVRSGGLVVFLDY